MIRKITSVGDWIRDSMPWKFRNLGRERAELFFEDEVLNLDLDIEGELTSTADSSILSCKFFFQHKHATPLEGFVEKRGNFRSLLPLMGLSITSPPNGIDRSYHLILLEDDNSLENRPIKQLGNTSAKDMFWMEFFSYKAVSIITDCSLDCTICNVHIRSHDIKVRTMGILIESFESIHTRIGPMYKQQSGHWLEIGDLNTLRLLEILVGNLDYSVFVEDDKLRGHNVLLTSFHHTIVPIAFDFQFLVFTASDYGAYKMLNYSSFVTSSKQSIKDLFPKKENLEPLIYLVSLIPVLNVLCNKLPITDSLKKRRIKFSNELAHFMTTYIDEKQGENICQFLQ
ncbi:hypothetical protein L4C36_17165 [Photobacterium japonica]|uniref:hypothetical protein n=1 Tax=Photobacterium japonica TaxID=2910235 RepID=UPI003D0DDC00